MYEYEVVKIKLRSSIIGKMKPEVEYGEVVNKYAKEGWRLNQIFAPPVGSYGTAIFYDLIFEREVEK